MRENERRGFEIGNVPTKPSNLYRSKGARSLNSFAPFVDFTTFLAACRAASSQVIWAAASAGALPKSIKTFNAIPFNKSIKSARGEYNFIALEILRTRRENRGSRKA